MLYVATVAPGFSSNPEALLVEDNAIATPSAREDLLAANEVRLVDAEVARPSLAVDDADLTALAAGLSSRRERDLAASISGRRRCSKLISPKASIISMPRWRRPDLP